MSRPRPRDRDRDRSFGIIGAGCAGLSLAVELLDRVPAARVTIVEPRTAFGRDRTWCWWRVAPTRWDDLATHRWTAWRAHAAGRTVEHRSTRHPYLHLPSDRFHDAALAWLDRSGRCSLHLGTAALGVGGAGGRDDDGDADGRHTATWIATRDGRLGPFETVFDGRPPQRATEGLEQRFHGREVRTQRPVFEPGVVELMDFRVSQAGGPHFMYVLPFADDHALVESTGLLPFGAPEPDREAAITAWLEQRGAGDTLVERTESGIIPMRSIPRPRGRVAGTCRIGSAAGVVKPATGYAFAGIQRHAQRLATGLAAGPRPAQPTIRRGAAEAMDRLMISLLRDRPDVAPEVLVRVLEGLGGDRTARFLGDHGGAGDLWAVLRATPTMPMLRHLVDQGLGRTGDRHRGPGDPRGSRPRGARSSAGAPGWRPAGGSP